MLTHERLKQALWLDPESGRFFWNEKVRGIKIGTEAGSFDAHGYGQIRIDRQIYKEHRLVWFYVTGQWPAGQIDHVNHQRRDNRFENLREVDNAGNHKNRPMQRNNTSGFVGVSFCRRIRMYSAYITSEGRRINLGNFKSLDDAVAARVEANKSFGFHENHGTGEGISKDPAAAAKQAVKRKLKALVTARNVAKERAGISAN